MKKNFRQKAQHRVFTILTIVLIAMLMILPAASTKSEAAQVKTNFSEKKDIKKLQLSSFRAFLGDTSLQGQPSGAYYTIEFSYLPTINYWQVDGVYDFYGNPVTISGTPSAGAVTWNGSLSQLTFTNLSIDLSVAGGTDHINDSFTLQMH